MTTNYEYLGNIRGPQGFSVDAAHIELDDHLRMTLSNAEIIDAGVARGPQGAQGLPGVNAVDNDAAVASYLSTAGVSKSRAALFGAVAVKPPTLAATVLTTGYAGTLPIEYHDGKVWAINGTDIQSSTDDGVTWTTVGTAPAGSVIGILWCADGEILVTNTANIWRSSGWAADPATATWTIKVTKSDPSGVGILRWGFDGDGTKFIATEYSDETTRAQSRYVWISTDLGVTWNIVFDKYITDPTSTSHMHAACYDPWGDRFWFVQGHGIVRGTYYSDDDGATWTKLGGAFQPDAGPTVLIATDDGIVCGSDSTDGGMYGIPRGANEMRRTARWQVPQEGINGFATRGYRDPNTGLVYVGFKSDLSTNSSAIAAGGARAAAFIWADSTKLFSKTVNPVVTDRGVLVADIDMSGSHNLLTGHVLPPGAVGFDDGNQAGGVSLASTATAVGPTATASFQRGVAVGATAAATGTDAATAIGFGAAAASRSVAVGTTAVVSASQADSVAVGYMALADATNAVVIGSGAKTYTNATGGVAIGKGAAASLSGVAVGVGAIAGATISNATAIAIGNAANASGTNGIAIGNGATAGTNAVALGTGVATNDTLQVNIGAKHIAGLEMVADPASPPVDGWVLYAKDNGAGKTQLLVKFRNNVPIVLAIQP